MAVVNCKLFKLISTWLDAFKHAFGSKFGLLLCVVANYLQEAPSLGSARLHIGSFTEPHKTLFYVGPSSLY